MALFIYCSRVNLTPYCPFLIVFERLKLMEAKCYADFALDHRDLLATVMALGLNSVTEKATELCSLCKPAVWRLQMATVLFLHAENTNACVCL